MQPQQYQRPTKPFSWSWSKLKNYRTCPKRHYEVDIAKTFKEDESEQLKWGNQLHEAMANYIGKGTPLPPMVARFKDWPDRVVALKKLGLETAVERKLAMTKDFHPCNFFDAGAWFRGVVDCSLTLPPEMKAMITLDWKTGGNVNPEFEQLALSAQLVFAHHPEVDVVVAIYVWFGHDTQTVKAYRREDMLPVWNGVMGTVTQMTDAHKTMTYPPKPSGLCMKYCPVKSCPYWGKGTR